MKINIPKVQKQGNGVDCGLFAIAHATTFALRQQPCFDIKFDHTKLRKHLISCLEEETMSEFPILHENVPVRSMPEKIKIKFTSKALDARRPSKPRCFTIENYCICNLPQCLGDQVSCDKCDNWFHKHCVNAPLDVSQEDVEFVCPNCEL